MQEATLRGQREANKRIVDIETRLLVVLRKEKGLGQVGESDVAVQEAALAQAQSALPVLEKQLAQQVDLLAALTAHLPSDAPIATFELADFRLPRELPVSIPSQLVEHRPDVRAAEENFHSAGAQIGVAIANRLPNVALTANPGTSALTLERLFAGGNNFYTLAGAVTQPVFDGSTLLHRQRGAEAAFDQAKEQYRSTVTTALQNVADSLRAIENDATALKTATAAERAASKSLDFARAQQKLGLGSFLTILIAEQTYQQALLNLVQAQGLRFSDTVALFQALGGGWWNRNDVAPSNPSTKYGLFSVIDRYTPQAVP